MTQEFVTLPRDVVEQALDALYCTDSQEGSPAYNFELKAIKELRAALEQPQNHVPDVGNMVPAGWKLVPSDATHKWAENLADRGMRISSLSSAISDMLAAAPQHPTTEQSSAVEQPQDEQEPVAWIEPGGNRVGLNFDYEYTITEEHPRDLGWLPLYTRPQPKREPLSTARIDELIEDGIFGGNPYELVRRLEEERGVFMTRPLTDEVIKDIHSAIKWHEFGSGLAFTRSIEAAHNIK